MILEKRSVGPTVPRTLTKRVSQARSVGWPTWDGSVLSSVRDVSRQIIDVHC